MKIGTDALYNPYGDNLLLVQGFYALKALYPQATLIVFTNIRGENILRHLRFIDQIIVLDQSPQEGYYHQEFLDLLNTLSLDLFILNQRRIQAINILKQSNCKQIIMRSHLQTLFSPKFKTILFRLFKHHRSAHTFKLIRLIDKGHFDKNFDSIDFANAKLQTALEHQNTIQTFFKPFEDTFSFVVGINPFCQTMDADNFSIQDWVSLIEKIAPLYPRVLFVFLNYKTNSYQFQPFTQPNIQVFVNDEDILNLVECIKRLDLLISTNTANIHIASNLQTPILEVISQSIFKQWSGNGGGWNKNYTCLLLPNKWKKDYVNYLQAFKEKIIHSLNQLKTQEEK